MKFQAVFIAITTISWLLTGCQFGPSAEQQLLDNTARNVILSNQFSFSQRTQQLVELSTTFCRQPDSAGLDRLREQWRQSMSAWQAVKTVNFGPITIDNQSWKIQFWPDSKNLIRRKALELLKSDDQLTIDRVSQASVVVQGLSALEYLLFDADEGQLVNYQADPLAERRCQLLQAVSQHSHRVAANLYHAWSTDGGNYLTHFTQTGDQNQDFPDPKAAISALVDTLVASVELAKGSQLAQPLGLKTKGNRSRPYLSEAWRSRFSSRALHANLEAAQALFLGAEGYGMDDYLIGREQAALVEKLRQLFYQATSQSAAAPVIFDALTNAEGRAQLQQLYNSVGDLLSALKSELPPAMGVTLGFNANDGD